MRDAGRTGVAVGFFDGVHVAHRELLSQAAAAFTFRNHPRTVLAPDRAPSLILSAADRLARLRGCGLDEVVAVDFTRELADTAPEEFAASLLVLAAKFTAAGAPRVLCGPNWRFGRGGVGDAALLRRLGAEVVEVPFVEYCGEAISSTRIREAIERGELEDAAAMRSLCRRLRLRARRRELRYRADLGRRGVEGTGVGAARCRRCRGDAQSGRAGFLRAQALHSSRARVCLGGGALRTD